jgi:V/A-type H+/Na+-transporting ATPase subunit D
VSVARSRISVPPGRSGKLWLEQRLAVASRAAGLLDRKLRILAAELLRLRERAQHTQREWESQCAGARRWLLRAVMLGGERAVELSAAGGQAQVSVSYTTTMGVSHPAAAHCVMSEPAQWEGPAMVRARQAYRKALAAATEHAVASAALAAIDAEQAATRYRLRAVRDRWIPQLREALAQAQLALEELERADAARLRRAALNSSGWHQA